MNNDTENFEDTDNSTNPENTGQRNEFRVLDFQDRCPDCDVAVGEPHIDNGVDGGCDVARCLVTGLQRLTCGLDHAGDHDCGRDVWTGRWPGDADCERLGWMLAPGLPDLNRLYTEATWDPAQRAWVTPPT
jgi:hypothetical protein